MERYLIVSAAIPVASSPASLVSYPHPAWVKSRLESDKSSRVTLDGWMQLIIVGRCDLKRKPQGRVRQGSVRGEAASGIAWRGISEE
jgi:hypothetical protein